VWQVAVKGSQLQLAYKQVAGISGRKSCNQAELPVRMSKYDQEDRTERRKELIR
jgi:hypothetical protein